MLPLSMRTPATIGVLLLAGARAGAEPPAPFSDQTAAMNATFTHHFDFADRTMAMGAGGAWGDYNGDGNVDLYVADRDGPNALFMNPGGGAPFVDVASILGVELPGMNSTGALWGDYDNDGDKDLYVMNRGDNVMFRNDGPGGPTGWIFTDVTAALGVEGFGRTSAAAYGDYDGDGYLDLYVSNHNYSMTVPAPGDPFRSDFFYHNVAGSGGERIFEDVAHAVLDSTILNDSVAHSVAFVDCDNDGDQDLYVVNEKFASADPTLFAENRLWRNDGPGGPGGWLFSDYSVASGANVESSPMGVAVADYNNDGLLDLAISDAGPNRLYQNQGGCVFSEVGGPAGIDRDPIPATGAGNVSWGDVWIDFDLDGDEDLLYANGRAQYTEATARQPNPMFENQGDPPNNTFVELAPPGHTEDPRSSRTVIKADYDGDGDEDVYVINFGVSARLLRNDQVGGDSLSVRLRGTLSNRDAVGARVKLSIAGAPDQYRVVTSGTTTGGGNDLDLNFGVSGHSLVDSITVDWPSGQQSVYRNLPVNTMQHFVEPGGAGVPALPAWGFGLLGAGLVLARRRARARPRPSPGAARRPRG